VGEQDDSGESEKQEPERALVDAQRVLPGREEEELRADDGPDEARRTSIGLLMNGRPVDAPSLLRFLPHLNDEESA
jgi:hypothetical protein